MNYDALIIAGAHDQALAGPAGPVNRQLILRNWLIGAYLVEFEQAGEDRAKYGERLLNRLAADLLARGVTGTSQQMLERMRAFYLQYPQASTLLPSSAMMISSIPLPGSHLSISSSPMRKSEEQIPTPFAPSKILQL